MALQTTLLCLSAKPTYTVDSVDSESNSESKNKLIKIIEYYLIALNLIFFKSKSKYQITPQVKLPHDDILKHTAFQTNNYTLKEY